MATPPSKFPNICGGRCLIPWRPIGEGGRYENDELKRDAGGRNGSPKFRYPSAGSTVFRWAHHPPNSLKKFRDQRAAQKPDSAARQIRNYRTRVHRRMPRGDAGRPISDTDPRLAFRGGDIENSRGVVVNAQTPRINNRHSTRKFTGRTTLLTPKRVLV